MSRSTATPRNIISSIDTIDQLFNAPRVNPFSDKAIDVLGESAMTRTTRRLLDRPLQNWDGIGLVIQLPANQITPNLQRKVSKLWHS